MSATLIACDILTTVGTPVRTQVLFAMPATARDYAIHGAASILDVERYRDADDEPRARRAEAYARCALRAAADLGHDGAKALLAAMPTLLPGQW